MNAKKINYLNKLCNKNDERNTAMHHHRMYGASCIFFLGGRPCQLR